VNTDTTTDASLAVRIGERLRALRKQRALTLAVLAQQAGISVSYLSAVEKGVNLPSLQVLAALTEALGVSIPSVLADEGRPHVRVSRIPAEPGVLKVSHPLLQLENAVLRTGAADAGGCPLMLDGRDVFVYVISGELELTVDGVAHRIGPGDAIDVRRAQQISWAARSAGVSIWSGCHDEDD